MCPRHPYRVSAGDPPVNWRATLNGPSGTPCVGGFLERGRFHKGLIAIRPGGTSDSSPAFQRRVAGKKPRASRRDALE